MLVSSFLSIVIFNDRSHSALVIRGCRLSNPTSGIKSSVRGVCWLSRIDQEGFFVLRFLGRSRRVYCVWATRFSVNKKEQWVDS